jgi:hypothetical protein
MDLNIMKWMTRVQSSWTIIRKKGNPLSTEPPKEKGNPAWLPEGGGVIRQHIDLLVS